MSLMFKPPRKFDPNLVETMLKENALLIDIVTEYQNKGVSEFNADESFRPKNAIKQEKHSPNAQDDSQSKFDSIKSE